MIKEKELLKTNRAWVEVNLANLAHNIEEIKKIIAPSTKIMAVVKANAYGHGIVEVAKYLAKIGINDFAVAALSEGIMLRQNGIKGNILILGGTSLEAISLVIKYDLIQTIVDYDYAENIKKLHLKQQLKAHLKINTGMNRLGESPQNFAMIKEMYQNPSLKVLGIFTHLSVCDSLEAEDVAFTKNQIDSFNKLIKDLEKENINVGQKHLQSSYGILNYPDLVYDYVRPGIIMYGVHSSKDTEVLTNINLKPVLSLKTRITSLKTIDKGDSVSYGRTFKGSKKTLIASVGIGYADGLPRSLSNKNLVVKINNSYGVVIGRICMDQMLIDVSEVNNVHVGDVVEVIGDDDNLRAENIAYKVDTITNELLSRLGSRLEIVTKTE